MNGVGKFLLVVSCVIEVLVASRDDDEESHCILLWTVVVVCGLLGPKPRSAVSQSVCQHREQKISNSPFTTLERPKIAFTMEKKKLASDTFHEC